MAADDTVLRAAVWQCDDAIPGDRRLSELDRMLEQQDAFDSLGLVVCPELFASGYGVGDALLTRAVATSEITERVSCLATRHRVALVIGYPERPGDHQLYNSAICVGATGTLLGHYRKRAIPPGIEKTYFTNGDPADPPELFDCGGMRCAILICYDAEFPESARAAASAGADILIVPTALSAQWRQVAERVMPSRAFENGVWLLYANYCSSGTDLDYAGSSCILTPYGLDAARAGNGPQTIVATLDKAAVSIARERLPYLADRALFT